MHTHYEVVLSVTCRNLSDASEVAQRLTAAQVGLAGEGYDATLNVWPENVLDHEDEAGHEHAHND